VGQKAGLANPEEFARAQEELARELQQEGEFRRLRSEGERRLEEAERQRQEDERRQAALVEETGERQAQLLRRIEEEKRRVEEQWELRRLALDLQLRQTEGRLRRLQGGRPEELQVLPRSPEELAALRLLEEPLAACGLRLRLAPSATAQLDEDAEWTFEPLEVSQ
jgi:colicin import membrane protein